VLEKRCDWNAQGFPVRSGNLFNDSAQGTESLQPPMLKPFDCL
jgi:hypothetical protein